MQSDEDKKNLFDLSLTDNIKISFEQSSCPYKNYACKIRDELLKQIEEDIQKIDEIKDEPCHSSEEVSGDNDARVEGGVTSMTVAGTNSGSGNGVKGHKEIKEEPHHPDDVSGDSDTRVEGDEPSMATADARPGHGRLVGRAVAGAIGRKRGVPASWTQPTVDRAAAGASCSSASTSRSGAGAPQQPSTVRSMEPKYRVPKKRKLSQKQRVEALSATNTPSGSVSTSGEKDLQGIGDDCRSLRSVRREYFAHSSLPSALVIEANVSTSMDIASVQAPTVPSASNTQADVLVGSSVADGVPPSTLELLKVVPGGEANEGSDLDSDFDDEFDEPVQVDSVRNIPDDKEIEEPIRETIRAFEREMDEEVERLVGTSASYEWVEGFDTFRGRREQFTGPAPGPLKDYDTPYDAFTEIWSNDIIQRIVLETNRYAKQTIDSRPLSSRSRLRNWTDTDVDDIYRLFAIYIYMGLCQRTCLDEYWRTNNILEMSKFRKVMSYDRYILLNKFLHFVDNLDESPTLRQDDGLLLSKKVSKLAPVITHLNSKFSSLYQLSRDICIESLVLFKGRLSWAQRINSKAARFGIKSFELCESKSGYLYKFHIYSGKNSESSDTAAVSSNLGGKSTKMVLDLLKGLEHRGHHLTMDNFYNCPGLSRYLKSLGYDSLGTLRVSRKNVPNDIAKVPENVAKGTIVARHCGDVSVVAWKDSKVVTMISTYHTDETYAGTRAGKVLVRPVCVKDYIRTMGGVDLMDQQLSMYMSERKAVKWYMKTFKRLLNISIHNAFVLFTSSRERRSEPVMTRRAFRYALADSLVERHSHKSLSEINQPVDVCPRLNRNIVHVPEIKKGTKYRRRCVVCFRQGIEKRVYCRCIQCSAYLCPSDCWLEWHSLAELKSKERPSRSGSKKT